MSDCVLNTVFTEVGCFSAIITDSNKWLFQTLKYWVHHVCYVPLSSHWLDYGFRLFTKHRRDVCSMNKWPLAQCHETNFQSTLKLSPFGPSLLVGSCGITAIGHQAWLRPWIQTECSLLSSPPPIECMAHSLPVLCSSKFSIYISV